MFIGLSVKTSKRKNVNLKKEFEIGFEKLKKELARTGEENIRHEIAKRHLDTTSHYDVKSKITKEGVTFSLESKKIPLPIKEQEIKVGDEIFPLALVNELFETRPEEEQKQNQEIIDKAMKSISEIMNKELSKLTQKILSKI